jgi:transcriptional regulator with XRE-family HTH domain
VKYQFVGERARRRRLAAGKTQKQVADDVGVSLRAVQSWEADQRAPSAAIAAALAESVGCDLRDLIVPVEEAS